MRSPPPWTCRPTSIPRSHPSSATAPRSATTAPFSDSPGTSWPASWEPNTTNWQRPLAQRICWQPSDVKSSGATRVLPLNLFHRFWLRNQDSFFPLDAEYGVPSKFLAPGGLPVLFTIDGIRPGFLPFLTGTRFAVGIALPLRDAIRATMPRCRLLYLYSILTISYTLVLPQPNGPLAVSQRRKSFLRRFTRAKFVSSGIFPTTRVL